MQLQKIQRPTRSSAMVPKVALIDKAIARGMISKGGGGAAGGGVKGGKGGDEGPVNRPQQRLGMSDVRGVQVGITF